MRNSSTQGRPLRRMYRHKKFVDLSGERLALAISSLIDLLGLRLPASPAVS